MKKLEEIDKNFVVATKIEKDDIKFYDAMQAPFKIYGVFFEGDRFRRIPEKVAKSVSEGVYLMHDRCAGGRIKFITDSPYVAIHAQMPWINRQSTFTLTGSGGFDLYAKRNGEQCFVKSFAMDYHIEDGYEQVIDVEHIGLYEYTINMPLYSCVSKLYIGLSENATLLEAPDYTYEKPIVYYGSSITQGGCATRAGMSYQEIISRRLDCNYINLGFSGNAKAEDEIAEYIADLDMSIFVYDYDHNAPTTEHLQKTHKRMFDIIRAKNPELPIIMMQRPKRYLTDWEKARFEIIKATFDDAVAKGDKNVYLIDAAKLTELCGGDGTVDNVHPTDLGFVSMAKAVGDVIEKLLKNN